MEKSVLSSSPLSLVKIPLKFKGRFTKGKIVYLEADNSSDNPKYNWVKTPQRT